MNTNILTMLFYLAFFAYIGGMTVKNILKWSVHSLIQNILFNILDRNTLINSITNSEFIEKFKKHRDFIKNIFNTIMKYFGNKKHSTKQ